MKIYKSEISDGLSDILNNHNKISMASVLNDTSDQNIESVLKSCPNLESAIATNEGQLDLHYVNTILVSTGWNRNDDVFSRKQVWSARKTPEDKPFNYEHDPSDIIGHITSNYVMDDFGRVIEDDTPEDTLPDKFHIVTGGVLYRQLSSRNIELSSRREEIIEGIKKGEWFVSMEALFSDFDYALYKDSEAEKIIGRSEDSAFLTKHLRAYGGTGEYQGYKVGRVIKNITFSGKGLVRKPANPDSVFIINDDNVFSEAEFIDNASCVAKNNDAILEENIIMANDNTNESLQQTIAELQKRLKEMDEAAVTAKFESLEADIAERDAKIVELTETHKSGSDKLAEAEAKVEELQSEVNTLTEAKENFEKELEAIRVEAATAARIALLTDSGLSKSDAEETVAKFADLNDEQFETIVEFAAKAQSENADETEASEELKYTSEPTETEAEAEAEEDSEEEDPAEEAAEPEALDDAEASEDATLAVAEESSEDLMDSLAEYLETSLHGETK